MDFHQKKGARFDAYSGFIEPILNRPTLTVRKYAFVKKVRRIDKWVYELPLSFV